MATPAPPDISSSGQGEWVMEGYGPRRDRATTEDLSPPLRVEHRFSVGGDTRHVSPVGVARGLLFVEGDRKLYALDLKNGKKRWYFDLPGSYISPAVAGDQVFVRAESGKNGYVLALAVNSGLKLWQFKFPRVGSAYDDIGGHVTSPVVAGGLVLVGASRTLYALDAKTGTKVWVLGLDAPVASSAAVADDTVYVADFTRLYAVDLKTGEKRWDFNHGAVSLFFAPVVVGNEVVITSYDTAYALDRQGGHVLWSRTIEARGVIPCGAAGNHVYVKSTGQLYALDRLTGEIVWSYGAGDFVSLPAITSQVMYVITHAGETGQLRALRLTDGAEVWHVEEARLANAAPVVAGGRVYVHTVNGDILVYGPSS
ncbi:MAG: PQQ-binding-like beta-propeller repeat protein [Anaerolineae bacterium]|nr:PQQ-binding-like beta-propeller repeat protein [Anaerolineae bacterium]